MPNNESRVRLSVHGGIPCLFPESSVSWVLLSLSDPRTWADSPLFSELEFPSLREYRRNLGALGLLSSRTSGWSLALLHPTGSCRCQVH